jgi:hypothetical protein
MFSCVGFMVRPWLGRKGKNNKRNTNKHIDVLKTDII